jgi:predicted O-methyltransferase YrrM
MGTIQGCNILRRKIRCETARKDQAERASDIERLLMSLPEHIHAAINHYIPVMEGWLTPERGCEMAELIIDNKPELLVEIGVFGGRSLVACAMALRENHKGKIWGIDSWRVDDAIEGKDEKEDREWWEKKIVLDDIHRGCMKAIWDHHLEPWAVIIRSASQYCYDLFKNIDQLYIDGSHSEVASCRDVELYLPRVAVGGLIWFDDTGWRSTQKALQMMNAKCDIVRDNDSYRLYRKR